MTGLVTVLAALSVYRLSMLVTNDAITRRPRTAIMRWAGKRQRHKVTEFVGCPWCVSIWLGPPVVGSALAWGTGWGWLLAAGSLSASAVTGVIASYARPG